MATKKKERKQFISGATSDKGYKKQEVHNNTYQEELIAKENVSSSKNINSVSEFKMLIKEAPYFKYFILQGMFIWKKSVTGLSTILVTIFWNFTVF